MIDAPSNKMYAVTIANECTRTEQYDHTPSSGQLRTLDNDFVAIMAENSGTYEYKYTVERRGNLSIFIDEYYQESLFYFYNEQEQQGIVAKSETNNADLSFEWGTNNVFLSKNDDLSLFIFFYFFPPLSDTYTLRLTTYYADEGSVKLRDSGVTLGRILFFKKWIIGGSCVSSNYIDY